MRKYRKYGRTFTWTVVWRWLFSSPCASSVSWILSLKLLHINTMAITITRIKDLHLLQTDQAVISSVQAELRSPDTAPRRSPDFTLSCQVEKRMWVWVSMWMWVWVWVVR